MHVYLSTSNIWVSCENMLADPLRPQCVYQSLLMPVRQPNLKVVKSSPSPALSTNEVSYHGLFSALATTAKSVFFCSSFTSRSSVLSLYTYQHFMCKEYYCLSAKKPFSSHGDRQLVQHQFTVAIIPWWNVWKWSFWTVFIIIITITTTVIDSLTLPT